MHAKQIAAVLAVVAIACAGIGAAYAYQASLNSSSNTVDAHYLEIGSTTGAYDSWFDYKVSGTEYPIDYNTVSNWVTDKTVITHTPLYYDPSSGSYKEATAVAAIGSVKAVAVNASPFQMSVNSTSMAETDMFTLGVEVMHDADDDGTIEAGEYLDLEGKYWLYYTINDIPGWIELNGTGVQKIMVSDDNTFIHSGSAAGMKVLSMNFTLYAVEFVSDQGAGVTQKVGYEDVDFRFTAVATEQAASADQKKVAITATQGESAATGATVFMQTAKTDGGLGYGSLYLNKATEATGVYTMSNLDGAAYAGAMKDTKIGLSAATVTPATTPAAVSVVIPE